MIYREFTDIDLELDESYEEVLTEGLTIAKHTPDELNKIAEKIISAIDKKIKNGPVARGVWSKDRKFGDEKSYIKSLAKNRAKISSNTKSKLKLNINILYLAMQGEYRNPQKLMNKVSECIRNEGFKINPKAKSTLKYIFGPGPMFYKKIDDENIIIIKTGVGYVESYGYPTNYTNINIDLIAAVPDEKTMKYLNINEATIFDNIEMI